MSKLLFHQKSLYKRRSGILAFVIFLIGLLFWSIMSYGEFISPLFLPTPSAVLLADISLYKNFNLLQDIWVSILRILFGFGLAAAIAVPLGMYLALNKIGEAVVEPVLSFIRYIPPSALLPLFLLWFGIGETSKILLICFGVLPYIAFMVYDVVAQTKTELVDAAYTLGAGNADVVWKVIVPSSLPGIYDTLRINIGAAWTFLVLAEIIASTTGLGHLIITSQRFIKTPNVIGAILIIGILGYLTDLFFKITYKIFFPWTEKSHA